MDGGISHGSMMLPITQVSLSYILHLLKQGKGKWFWHNMRVKDTRHLGKGRVLRGCSCFETSATSSPESSSGRFWDQLGNPVIGRGKGNKLVSKKLLPSLRLICSSKQTIPVRGAACPLSFIAEHWILKLPWGREVFV